MAVANDDPAKVRRLHLHRMCIAYAPHVHRMCTACAPHTVACAPCVHRICTTKVERLLELGANPDSGGLGIGMSPIHLASGPCDGAVHVEKLLQLLLRGRANTEARDQEGQLAESAVLVGPHLATPAVWDARVQGRAAPRTPDEHPRRADPAAAADPAQTPVVAHSVAVSLCQRGSCCASHSTLRRARRRCT